MTDKHRALEHLLKAKRHAQKAEQLFEDDSKGESVANNTRRWAESSVDHATRHLSNDTEQ